MEANSSQMIFQKELPILQPVKTSRFWSEPDSTSTRSESPASSSSKSVTPMARPSSSSKKSLTKGAPATSKEQDSSYRIDKRSSYTPLKNKQHNAVHAATAGKTTAIRAPKKTSGSDNANAVKNVAKPDKALKHIAATAPKARSNDSSARVKNIKADIGTTRRLSRPPPATIGSKGEVHLEGMPDIVATKGKGGAGNGVVLATSKGAAGSTEAIARRRARGEKEQRPKLGSHAKK